MQETSERQVDAAVTRTLKFDTLVTPSRQQNARERLLRAAAEQSILPPLEAAERTSARGQAHSFGQQTLRFIVLLMTDETIYKRAHQPRRLYQYYNGHGRYAFTLFHVAV